LRLPANCSPSQTPSSGTKQPSDEPPDKHSCQPGKVLGLKKSSAPQTRRRWGACDKHRHEG
ncbi:hypothetical protein CN168_08010, partial [Sinorhizobium medicae]